MNRDQRIATDLAKHFDERIHTALSDFFDRCEMLDVDYESAKGAALTVLGMHLTVAALAVEANETEFLTMCRWHYHNAKQAVG